MDDGDRWPRAGLAVRDVSSRWGLRFGSSCCRWRSSGCDRGLCCASRVLLESDLELYAPTFARALSGKDPDVVHSLCERSLSWLCRFGARGKIRMAGSRDTADL